MIAKCGMICTECEAYIATQDDDLEAKKKIAAQWTKSYEFEFTPETISCDGCQTETGQLCAWADGGCEIRKCAVEKNVATCANCDDYACEILVNFQQYIPGAKACLDELRGDK
ncbi:MAG: DUF3795 domain-containing protein [Candidatus Electryoneaceae bacterium]|nr:DUF3795 domain-containing protein [Candidatus Electryoneaceae bacterium]